MWGYMAYRNSYQRLCSLIVYELKNLPFTCRCEGNEYVAYDINTIFRLLKILQYGSVACIGSGAQHNA